MGSEGPCAGGSNPKEIPYQRFLYPLGSPGVHSGLRVASRMCGSVVGGEPRGRNSVYAWILKFFLQQKDPARTRAEEKSYLVVRNGFCQ